MTEPKFTKGPWAIEKAKGWGGDWCILDSAGQVIFKAVKPKTYYTDFAPGTEPGSVILSDEIARKQGRYVATPEIRAAIEADEARRARLTAAAPQMYEALREARETIRELVNARWSEAEGSVEDWTKEIDAALSAAVGEA